MFTKGHVRKVLEEECGQYMEVTDAVVQQVYDGFAKFLNPAAALGSIGGKSTSEAKRQASAANGKKGGRPRKTTE